MGLENKQSFEKCAAKECEAPLSVAENIAVKRIKIQELKYKIQSHMTSI